VRRTSDTVTLRLGLIFTVTGIIILAIRLFRSTGRLAPGVATAIGVALLVVGLVLLYFRSRSGSGKGGRPGKTR
jgi:hypothetical protein